MEFFKLGVEDFKDLVFQLNLLDIKKSTLDIFNVINQKKFLSSF